MSQASIKVGALLAAAALGVGACGGAESDEPTSASTPAQEQTPSNEMGSGPEIMISSPGDGEEVGSTFTARVELSDFELDPEAVGEAPSEGQGHLHFSLDDGKYDRPRYSGANGELAAQLGTVGKYSPAVEPMITYENLPAGEHTLRVVAADNDHSETEMESEVTFTVADEQARTGANGEKVAFTGVESTGDGFTARVSLTDFEIDADAVGKRAQDNTGHLHFSLEGGKYDKPRYSGANGELAVQLGTDGKYSPAVEPMITYDNLPEGRYKLKAFLANNDHSDTGAVGTRTIQVG